MPGNGIHYQVYLSIDENTELTHEINMKTEKKKNQSIQKKKRNATKKC